MQEQGVRGRGGGGPARRARSAPGAAAEPAVTFRDDDGGRVRNYDELEGNEGRSVFFRPHRYTAADLEPLRAVVVVEGEGGPVECPLRDVSQNGAAFAWPRARGAAPAAAAPGGPAVRRATRPSGATRWSARSGPRATPPWWAWSSRTSSSTSRRSSSSARCGPGGATAPSPASATGAGPWPGTSASRRSSPRPASSWRTRSGSSARWRTGSPGTCSTGRPTRPAPRSSARVRNEFVADMVRHTEKVDAALREIPGGVDNPAAREWSLRSLDALPHAGALLPAGQAQALRLPGGLRDDELHLRAAVRGADALRPGHRPGLPLDPRPHGGALPQGLHAPGDRRAPGAPGRQPGAGAHPLHRRRTRPGALRGVRRPRRAPGAGGGGPLRAGQERPGPRLAPPARLGGGQVPAGGALHLPPRLGEAPPARRHALRGLRVLRPRLLLRPPRLLPAEHGGGPVRVASPR